MDSPYKAYKRPFKKYTTKTGTKTNRVYPGGYKSTVYRGIKTDLILKEFDEPLRVGQNIFIRSTLSHTANAGNPIINNAGWLFGTGYPNGVPTGNVRGQNPVATVDEIDQAGRFGSAGYYQEAVPTAVGNTDYTNSIVNIPQGNDSFQREGRKIIVKRIYVKAEMLNNLRQDGGQSAFDTVRLLLILDRQSDKDGSETTGDIIDENQNGLPDYLGGQNLDNIQRYLILKDEIHNFSSYFQNTTGIYTAQSYFIDWEIPTNIPIEYNGGTGQSTEITSNNIFLMATGSEGSTIINVNTRVLFHG